MREIEVDEAKTKTYEDLLLFLNLNPEVYIVLKDGIPVPLDEEIERNGELNILRVVSGG
ncbi:MAG: MoaD/ThiS family protein [Methanocellales archaeon]